MHTKPCRYFFIIFLAFVFLSSLASYALSGSLRNTFYLYRGYKNDIGYSSNKIEKNWELSLGAAAAIGLSLFADRGVRSYFVKHRSNGMDHFTDAVKPLGNGFLDVPVALGLGAIGYAYKDEKLMNASYTSLESMLTAGIITGLLKVTVGRERPDSTSNPFNFKPFDIHNTYESFPSGDVTAAWAFVTPYAVYYHQPILYLLPLSVNIERMYRNEHWLSDTLAGTVVGFFTGYLFSESHINNNFSIYTNGRAIAVSWKFR